MDEIMSLVDQENSKPKGGISNIDIAAELCRWIVTVAIIVGAVLGAIYLKSSEATKAGLEAKLAEAESTVAFRPHISGGVELHRSASMGCNRRCAG